MKMHGDADRSLINFAIAKFTVHLGPGGSRVVSFIVNGRFCDGGEYRQFGWQLFSPYFRHVNWCEPWEIGQSFNGKLSQLKVYNRIIMTAEAGSLDSY
jgi:hypothetical protein